MQSAKTEKQNILRTGMTVPYKALWVLHVLCALIHFVLRCNAAEGQAASFVFVLAYQITLLFILC